MPRRTDAWQYHPAQAVVTLIPLPTDVVLIPGNTVPLKLSLPEELRLLQASLSHPVQTRRIIILVRAPGHWCSCCTQPNDGVLTGVSLSSANLPL